MSDEQPAGNEAQPRLLDRVNGPGDLKGLERRRAPGPCPGGARADHRRDRRDRRPLRRQPGRLRARRRAPQPARLPARQDHLGRRPPGLSAQGADGPARAARHDPPVRRAGAVLLGVRVRARHHGRRTRLDLDRLRRRAQGGDAQGDRHRGPGDRRDRGRCADRRRRLRGAPQRRRARDPDRDRPQRQRDVDLAERRRPRPLLPALPAQPDALPRSRGGRGAPHPAAARPGGEDRAAGPGDQGGDQGLRGARPPVRGARPRLRRGDRRPRRGSAAPRDRRRPGRPAAGRRPHPHGQGQGLRRGGGGRPRGDGEVARGEAEINRQQRAGRVEACARQGDGFAGGDREAREAGALRRRRSTRPCSRTPWWPRRGAIAG